MGGCTHVLVKTLKLQHIFPEKAAVKLISNKFFSDKNICPKSKQRKRSQSKVNEAKTLENSKYEAILSQLGF